MFHRRLRLVSLLLVFWIASHDDSLRADLVGWWPFDEDLEDQSEKGNDGFLDSPLFDGDVPDAIADGTSLSLDGTTGVEILEDPSLDSEVFTLSMFILDRGQTGPFSRLTSRETDHFEAAIGAGGQLKYFSRAEVVWNETQHFVPFETWQHIAYVSDGLDLTVYADGELAHGPVPLTVTPSGIRLSAGPGAGRWMLELRARLAGRPPAIPRARLRSGRPGSEQLRNRRCDRNSPGRVQASLRR